MSERYGFLEPESEGRPSPEVIADRYEVVRLLAENPLGCTYEVRDRQLEDRHVALTLVGPELSSDARFREEFCLQLDLAQTLAGGNVNRVLDRGTESAADGTERIYFTADLEDGESLRKRLEREDTLAPRQAMEIACQVLLALAEGHEKNLLHGNLKPTDVILCRGVPKTVENPFGIHVKLLRLGVSEPPSRGEIGDSESAVYRAPEEVEGKPLDARSDLFSVGMILTECLLGRRGFQSGLAEEIRLAVVERDTAGLAHLLEDLEPAVRRILLKALSRNRERRYSSAREFRTDLESCPAFREPARTPAVVKSAVVLLLLTTLGAGFYGFWAHGTARKAQSLLSKRTSEYEGRIQTLQEAAGRLEKQLEEAQSRPGAVPVEPIAEPGVDTGDLHEGGQGEAWVRLLAAGPEQDPREAFELAVAEDGSVDPHLLELAEKYAAGLRSRLLRGDELDREALAREPHLAEWARLLGESETARKWPVSAEIRLFARALGFYHQAEIEPIPWNEVYSPSTGDPADWRLELYLRARVLEKWPWLLPCTQRTAIYASKPGAGAPTFRQTRAAVPPEEGQCVFNITVYDESGDRLTGQESTIQRTGTAYEWAGTRVDLAQDEARIESYEPELLGFSVPRQAGASAEELKRFAEEVEKLGPMEGKCLVFETPRGTLWLSAKLGLVRLELPAAVQELVYLSVGSLDE